VLSLDTTGPFHEAADLQGKGKYVSVGEMTWMAPVHSPLNDDDQDPSSIPPEALERVGCKCKMRLEQRISLRRNINQENRHQRMVLDEPGLWIG